MLLLVALTINLPAAVILGHLFSLFLSCGRADCPVLAGRSGGWSKCMLPKLQLFIALFSSINPFQKKFCSIVVLTFKTKRIKVLCINFES